MAIVCRTALALLMPLVIVAVVSTVAACSREQGGQMPPVSGRSNQADADQSPASGEALGPPIDVAANAPAKIGKQYYVSLNGNNEGPGTKTQPLRTIQEAIARAKPGDTIVVAAGTYEPPYAEGTYGHGEWNANRDDGRGGINGTAGAPITLRAEHPATEVAEDLRTTISGDGQGFGLFLNGFEHITIDGFAITGFEVGIGLQEQSGKLTIRRNVLYGNTSAGIECAACTDSRFEGNAFLDRGPPYPELGDAVQDYGLSFYSGSANNIVVNNYFFGKHNQALSWKRRAGPGYAAYNTFEGFMYTAIYLGQNDDEPDGGDMTSFDVTVEYNLFRDAVDRDTGAYYRARSPIVVRNIANAVVRYNYIENTVGSAITVLPCEGGYYCATAVGRRPIGVEVYGNTIVDIKRADPHTGDEGSPAAFNIVGRGYADDYVEVYNNTVHNAPLVFQIEGTPAHVATRETDSPPTIAVRNNNLADISTGVQGDTSTTVFAHNNWYGADERSSVGPRDVSDLNLDPQLVGPFGAFDPADATGPALTFAPDFSPAARYRLRQDSPLIDAGTDVGLTFRGRAPDIGANELGNAPPS